MILSNNGWEMIQPHKDNRCLAFLSKWQRQALCQPALVSFARAWQRTLMGIFLLTCLPACISYIRPLGEWNEPVDLRLDGQALQGLRIKVACQSNDGEGQLTASDDEECQKLRVVIGAMGARILYDEVPAEVRGDTGAKNGSRLPSSIGDAKLERADYLVNYVAYPTSSDFCGKTFLLFVLSFGIGPCVEDGASRAELIVTDLTSGAQLKRSLETGVRQILGLPALSLLLSDMSRPVTRQDFRREAGKHLLKYVQNTVYSFASRRRLATERPRLAQSPFDGKEDKP